MLNGHSDSYSYGGGTHGVGNTDFAICYGGSSLQASGCQEHYSTGWSDIFIRWILGQGDPNPYPCP